MRRLNAVLDALCQQQPDFCCPITHDIMRQPVTTSTGRAYEASALRTHCATQRSQGVRPTCPLTTRVLDPAQVRMGVARVCKLYWVGLCDAQAAA